MKNIILKESTYKELRAIKDKLNDILTNEDLPRVSFSKTLIVCWKLKKGVISYHRPVYEHAGGPKSISINKQANVMLAEMRFEYEKSYEKGLSYDKAIFWLTQDIMSELEIDAIALAERMQSLPKGSVKRRDYVESRY